LQRGNDTVGAPVVGPRNEYERHRIAIRGIDLPEMAPIEPRENAGQVRARPNPGDDAQLRLQRPEPARFDARDVDVAAIEVADPLFVRGCRVAARGKLSNDASKAPANEEVVLDVRADPGHLVRDRRPAQPRAVDERVEVLGRGHSAIDCREIDPVSARGVPIGRTEALYGLGMGALPRTA